MGLDGPIAVKTAHCFTMQRKVQISRRRELLFKA